MGRSKPKVLLRSDQHRQISLGDTDRRRPACPHPRHDPCSEHKSIPQAQRDEPCRRRDSVRRKGYGRCTRRRTRSWRTIRHDYTNSATNTLQSMAMNALLNQGGNKQSSHSSGLGGLAQSFLGGSSSNSNQSHGSGSGNMLGSIASSLLSSGHNEKPQQGSHASSSQSGQSGHSGGFGSMVNSFLGGGSVRDKYMCSSQQN